jgi:uncharacterized protein (TIGR03067 family)
MHLLLFLAVIPSAAPPVEKGFTGIWKLTAVEMEDVALPARQLNKANDYTLVIVGENYAWRAPTSLGRPASADRILTVGRSLTHAGTLKPDAKKKALDLTITEGRDKGNVLLALFELKGDTLRIATTNPGGKGARPEELKGKHFLYTFERDTRATQEQADTKRKELQEAATKEKRPKKVRP